jgi:hypothetical protein
MARRKHNDMRKNRPLQRNSRNGEWLMWVGFPTSGRFNHKRSLLFHFCRLTLCFVRNHRRSRVPV